MFSLSELASLLEWRGGCYKLLKPWWEVFMEYLVMLMLMVSVLAGTLLLSRDGVVCLPVHPHSAPLQNHSLAPRDSQPPAPHWIPPSSEREGARPPPPP
ncbi:hypothetical protein AAFF_G00339710, partial [Aldrovandia affinis]